MMIYHQKPNTFVGQVHLLVEDLEKSTEFYQSIIGFRFLSKTNLKTIFTTDGLNPLLTIEKSENAIAVKQPKTGLYHFALLVPSRLELAKTLVHLLQTGYPLQGASDHLVSEAIYLADPDGNGIEIYTDRPSEEWKWNGDQIEMASLPLQVQELIELGSNVEWDGLSEFTVMGHIHLQVSELASSEEFYSKGLGFNVVSRYGQQALFISTGQYHHHIGLNTWNSAFAKPLEPNTIGIKWYSVVLESEEVRKKVMDNLKKLNVVVTEEEGEFYTKDPSGIKILLEVSK
jgi:catechol 2,3-dioxygenase